MINVEEALDIVLANLPPRRTEQIDFLETLGRIPAENIVARCNIPPFNRSSMDGYALRAADLEHTPARLALAGEVRAGGGSVGVIRPGQAVAIMTGAPMPEGADAVQMLELAELSPDGSSVTILKPVGSGENVVPVGYEAAQGEVVVEAGRAIGSAEIAVLATFGYKDVTVWKRPRVAVIATGDELVEMDQTPLPDQIRNSNSYSLSGQLLQLGLEPERLGIARDDKNDLRRRITLGLERDMLILTGGVSMGAYDFAKEVFEELGLKILFSRVAMKPGKPTVFARKGDKLVFGLPGNPVATFIAFENFVRPALGYLCGRAQARLPRIQGELQRGMKQMPGRTAFLPAWVTWEPSGWKVDPLQWKGSADMIGFSKANATVIFPKERSVMERGETVEAMLLADFFARDRLAGTQEVVKR
jgi:molybdopterin molybdotransferase